MNNEIKEILDDIKRHLDYTEATKQSSIRDKEIKIMYDYITNLQEKINKSKEIYLKELNKCNKNGNYVSKVAVDMFNVLEGNK